MTRLYPGISDGLLVQLKDKQIELPLSHQKLLKKSNGIEAYGGYFRLFGFGFDKYQDLVTS